MSLDVTFESCKNQTINKSGEEIICKSENEIY